MREKQGREKRGQTQLFDHGLFHRAAASSSIESKKGDKERKKEEESREEVEKEKETKRIKSKSSFIFFLLCRRCRRIFEKRSCSVSLFNCRNARARAKRSAFRFIPDESLVPVSESVQEIVSKKQREPTPFFFSCFSIRRSSHSDLLFFSFFRASSLLLTPRSL